MKPKIIQAKVKRKKERATGFGIGPKGLMLAAMMLLAVLMLNSNAVSQGNESDSNATDSDIIPMSGIENLSTNATSDIQEYARSQLIARWQISAEREAAAERFKANWTASAVRRAAAGENVTEVAPTVGDPGGVPHYFGPYPNYANSPMPTGGIASITVTNGGSGYGAPRVTITDLYDNTKVLPASATAVVVNGVITRIMVDPGGSGSGYTSPVVTITDAAGTGATATAMIGGTLSGGIQKFIDPLPVISVAIPDKTTYPPGGKGYTSAPEVIISDLTGTGAVATATVAGGTVTGVTVNPGGNGYTANPTIIFRGGGATTQAIGKATVVNGVITGITLLGCDYYEIELGEYNLQMHSQLSPTKLRGYKQTNDPGKGPASEFSYFGPLILAERDRPVRIKFTNNLPTEAGGDLFLPVDTTVMGAGMGPDMNMVTAAVQQADPTIVQITTMDPHTLRVGEHVMLHGFTPDAYNGEFVVTSVQDNMNFQIKFKSDPGPAIPPLGHVMEMYAQNRATLHLHGGYVPWISDGTPHQWITPAGEQTQYPEGVSVKDIPDMGVPEDGSMTFFYNNQQSARLMFYHDHSYGITRLNVYAGEAAAYLLMDQVEKDMIEGTDVSGINLKPTPAQVLPDTGIPLVIQDKTFVDSATIDYQDPTWNWGTGTRENGKITNTVTGDLWYPHVYMTNQNPADVSGMNAFGRWHFGPWFWPPTSPITYPPIPNPYYIDAATTPWENPEIPATLNPSMAMEAFMDTPTVNGAAYPYLEVEPKAYRFRILNAADDRFLNLQLYKATNIISGITVDNGGTGYTAPTVIISDINGNGATAEAIVVDGTISGIKLLTVGSGYSNPRVDILDATGQGAQATATVYTSLTEVGMVPASPCTNLPTGWPTDGREGGVPDPTKAGPSFIQIGTEGGFLPAPVEIPNLPIGWNFDQTNFDFGNVNQGTLILGPAERADVIVDFTQYAGNTLILYNDAPAPFPAIDPRYDYYTGHPDLTDTGGAPTTHPGYGPNTRTIMQIRVDKTVTTPFNFDLATLKEVFKKTADKRGVFEVSQDEIIVPQAEYNSAYDRTDLPADPYVRIFEGQKTFTTLSGTIATIVFEPKAIQDEMGETYDTKYGRMSAMLGLQLPVTAGAQAFTMYPYASPPVEIIKNTVYGTPIGSADDGTQIWKITHNGVDTHTVHVHLYNAQLINRVAWDNALRVPDLNELGWKETIRVNPLQDTIIALRPTAPTQPFSVPNSTRPLDPTMPLDHPLETPPGGFKDPNAEPVTITNHLVNFGWEYVWHCHLLAHEEMDMMHNQAFVVPPEAPSNLVAALGGSVILTWQDNSAGETGFTIQRDTDINFPNPTTLGEVGPNKVTYTDTTTIDGMTYYYRVMANNVVGDTESYAPADGFPTKSVSSAFSNTATITVEPSVPAAPSDLTGAATRILFNILQDRVTLNWKDNSNNENGFTIQRSRSSSFSAVSTYSVGANVVTFSQSVMRGGTYWYRVRAFNAAGNSGWSNPVRVTAP